MAETDIELKVGLDTRNVSQKSRDLRKEISRIFDAQGAKELDSKTKSLQASLAKTAQSARNVAKQIQELNNAKVPTDAFSKATGAVDALEQKLYEARLKYQELADSGASDMYLRQIAQGKDGIVDLEDQLEEARGYMQRLVDSGKAFTPGSEANAEKIDALQQKLSGLNNQMVVGISKAYEYDESLKETESAEEGVEQEGSGVVGIVQSLMNGFETLAQSVVRGVAGLKGFAKALPGKLLNAAVSGVKKLAGAIKNLAGKALSAAGNALKRFGSNLMQSLNHKHVSKFGSSFKTMLGAVLGANTLYAMFRKLITAAKEGMTNLAKFRNGNNETNQSISMLMSSLTQLKNSFAVAFAPILNVVAPVLNTLIQLLVTAANAVGRFFAAFGGKTTAIQATKVNQNYAKSLGGVASGAKEATGALGDYDELKVIGQDNSSGGGGSSGGGIDPNSMFEEVPIDSSISDMVDKIKEAWKNADFTEIGRMIGEKTKSALDTASEFLETVAQPFAYKLGKSIATGLNGFFSTPGLADSLGNTVAQVLNTALNFAYGFVKNFDFEQFGTFVGTALTSAITNFDWKMAGETVGLSINGFFSTLEGFAKGWDASAISDSVALGINTAIDTIDWANDAKALSDFGKDILDTLSGTIEKINWQTLGSDVVKFIKGIDWSGLATSLSEGIGAALGGLAGFIWGIIKEAWSSVVSWWKENAYEDGKFTMKGLLQGIIDIFVNIGTWIKDHIFTPFINGFKKAFGIASPSKVMKEQGGYIVEGLLEPIKKIPEKVAKIFDSLKTKIKNRISSITKNAKEKFGTMKTNLKTISGDIKSKVSEKFTGLKTKISSITTSIRDGIKNKFTSAKDSAVRIFESLQSKVSAIFTGIWNVIKFAINAILGGIEKMANGVISGFNTMIGALNKLKFTVPDWVPKIGGKSMGLNIDTMSQISIPRLAQGAVIPPNDEFLAVLGDQKRGTNIEAPLDTIVEAFRQVVGENNNNNAPIVLQLNGRNIAEVVWDESDKKYKQSGVRPRYV